MKPPFSDSVWADASCAVCQGTGMAPYRTAEMDRNGPPGYWTCRCVTGTGKREIVPPMGQLYVIIQPNEDGAPVTFLYSREQMEQYLADKDEEETPTNWVTRESLPALGNDQNYWPEDSVLLLKAEVVIPVEQKVRWRLP